MLLALSTAGWEQPEGNKMGSEAGGNLVVFAASKLPKRVSIEGNVTGHKINYDGRPFKQDGVPPHSVSCLTTGLQAVDWAWRTNIMARAKADFTPCDLLLWIWAKGEI
jgi:hypothetical protein